MPGRHRAPAGRGTVVAGVLAVVAVLLGCTLLLVAANRPSSAPVPRAAPAAHVLDARAAVPVRVRIPLIGVDAPVGPLEVDARGVLPAPSDAAAAGWWRAGPEPGERGAAVLAGHVDSRTGPAAFFRLGELPPGARVLVERADGSVAEFAVQRVERHPKAAFPTGAVYGPTAASELRLVTCGGTFDRDHGRYRDNVVVFAVRAA